MTVWDIYFSRSLKCVFILCVCMYTAIFSNFNLSGWNKNWRIVNEERQIVYCFYTENFIVNETQFISKYESQKREQFGKPYLKERYSRPSLLLSCCCIALIQGAISPLMNVFYLCMMDVAKSSNRWLAGWKLRHAIGFPINCRTAFSPTRGRITLLQIQIVPKFQIFCQTI